MSTANLQVADLIEKVNTDAPFVFNLDVKLPPPATNKLRNHLQSLKSPTISSQQWLAILSQQFISERGKTMNNNQTIPAGYFDIGNGLLATLEQIQQLTIQKKVPTLLPNTQEGRPPTTNPMRIVNLNSNAEEEALPLPSSAISKTNRSPQPKQTFNEGEHLELPSSFQPTVNKEAGCTCGKNAVANVEEATEHLPLPRMDFAKRK